MNEYSERRTDPALMVWLLVCALAIYAMIVLGGVTRLTESGLSIVEWKPVVGVVPPLNEAEWEQEFSKYQQYPEYNKVNAHMDLAGFKSIFWLEYFHRLLGRLIGLLFFVPLLWFWWRGAIPSSLKPRLLMLFVFGGLQGALGWFMVKSGLVDNPRVSQYRLTAHLGLAVAIYGYIVWLIAGMLWPALRYRRAKLAWLVIAVVFLMILTGGLVAGTRAGHAYNTWPLMAGQWLPPGLYDYQPAWLAAFEQITTIQFNHRTLAYVVVALVFALFFRLRRQRGVAERLAYGLLAALLLQLGLGISTLLLAVPVWLGALHQAGAILLFTCVLLGAFHLRSQVRRQTEPLGATAGAG